MKSSNMTNLELVKIILIDIVRAQVSQVKPTLRGICYISALSRFWLFVFQVLFNLLPDHQADAFNPPVSESPNFLDKTFRMTLDGFAKWDARYILHVTENGYGLKQTYAFFPLLPILIRLAATLLNKTVPFLSFYTSLIVSGVFLNFFLFVGAAASLFELTLNIFGCPQFAFIAAALFSINPASIFFSSCYTESLYAFCVFNSLALLSDKNRRSFWQELKFSFWFALAGATRSNGSVNCGFIMFYFLSDAVHRLRTKQICLVILQFFKAVILCFFVLLPTLLFNLHGYVSFCICPSEAPDLECDIPAWCNAPFPLIYDHVQRDWWGLGMFSYYEIKKLPNFLLASPVVVLSLYSSYVYLKDRSDEILSLGLISSETKTRTPTYMFASRNVFPFYIHLLFLVFFALLFMHVEVTTRMVMSSSPVIYWTVASFIYKDSNKITCFPLDIHRKLRRASRCCLYYFFAYFILGVLLHCNYYPWT